MRLISISTWLVAFVVLTSCGSKRTETETNEMKIVKNEGGKSVRLLHLVGCKAAAAMFIVRKTPEDINESNFMNDVKIGANRQFD